MEVPDPKRWAEVIEEYLPQWGPLLIRAVLFFGLLALISFALVVVFGWFVGGLVWPFLMDVFGAQTSGITLDNIESIIIVLALAIIVLVAILAAFVYIVARGFRRRVVPQRAIDALADLRDEAISIYNDVPSGDSELDAWHRNWQEWRERVIATLKNSFTKAERLSFQRLGLIPEHSFGHAYNPQHNHYLMQLAKQLVTLEDLIQRHQERH